MKVKIILPVAFLLVMMLAGLSSCKKEKSMEAVVIVRLHHDTTILVPEAEVILSVPINNNPGSDIQDIVGYTDYKGEFRQAFDLPVQLNINVTKDTLQGIGVLTLNDPGETFTKSVFIY